MNLEQYKVKSNGHFSIVKDVYNKEQHPNQQNGLDKYVDVVDHRTGNINSVKLYKNNSGLHFKKGGTWYLADFKQDVIYIPFQILGA